MRKTPQAIAATMGALVGLLLVTGACSGRPSRNDGGPDQPSRPATAPPPTTAPTGTASRAPRSLDPACAQQTKGWTATFSVHTGRARPGQLTVFGFSEKPAQCWDQFAIRLHGGQEVSYRTSYLTGPQQLRIIVVAPLGEGLKEILRPGGAAGGFTYVGSTERETTVTLPLPGRRPFKLEARAPIAEDADNSDWLIVIRIARR